MADEEGDAVDEVNKLAGSAEGGIQKNCYDAEGLRIEWKRMAG